MGIGSGTGRALFSEANSFLEDSIHRKSWATLAAAVFVVAAIALVIGCAAGQIQKQLDRNGTLPPGLQKRVEPFPEDLERQLPSFPAIYRRATIGRDVIILDTRTQRIIDVIHDIFDPR